MPLNCARIIFGAWPPKEYREEPSRHIYLSENARKCNQPARNSSRFPCRAHSPPLWEMMRRCVRMVVAAVAVLPLSSPTPDPISVQYNPCVGIREGCIDGEFNLLPPPSHSFSRPAINHMRDARTSRGKVEVFGLSAIPARSERIGRAARAQLYHPSASCALSRQLQRRPTTDRATPHTLCPKSKIAIDHSFRSRDTHSGADPLLKRYTPFQHNIALPRRAFSEPSDPHIGSTPVEEQ